MKTYLFLLPLAALTVACNGNQSKSGESAQTETAAEAQTSVSEASLGDVAITDTLTAYRVIKPTHTYFMNPEDFSFAESEEVAEGSVICSMGALEVTPMENGDWLNLSDRGEEIFVPLSDVKAETYLGSSTLPVEDFAKILPATYKNEAGTTLKFFILDLGDFGIEQNEDFPLNDTDDRLFMMQVGEQAPQFIMVEEGAVKLCNCLLQPTHEPGDFVGVDNIVVDGKLTCDAVVSTFYDPDFYSEVYYVPAEKGFYMGGEIYKIDN